MMMKSTILLDMLITTNLLLCMSTPMPSDQVIEMPITTVGDPSSTIHLVAVEFGTPPQTLHLLADTGSDTTWVFCARTPDESSRDHHHHHHRTFYHSRSSTFRFLLCSSPSCAAAGRCTTPWEACPYAFEYDDDSSTAGAWATETLTVKSNDGSEVKIGNVIIGCSDWRSTNFSDADGVLALSANYPSLTSQMAHKFGKKSFSFGLAEGDHLTFGEDGRTDFSREEMQYVKLVNTDPALFFVEVLSLSVDDVELDVPKSVWEFEDRYRSGGVILDTGTTSTYVAEAAYRAIRAYFVEFFRDYDNVEVSSSNNICFGSYTYPELLGGVRLPRVSVEFEGGARLEPTVEGVYYKDKDGMSCLAIWPVDDGEASVIGSGMQKGYFWEYDLVKQRAGFVPLRQQQLRRIS